LETAGEALIGADIALPIVQLALQMQIGLRLLRSALQHIRLDLQRVRAISQPHRGLLHGRLQRHGTIDELFEFLLRRVLQRGDVQVAQRRQRGAVLLPLQRNKCNSAAPCPDYFCFCCRSLSATLEI
jgi:hypothetical protein